MVDGPASISAPFGETAATASSPPSAPQAQESTTGLNVSDTVQISQEALALLQQIAEAGASSETNSDARDEGQNQQPSLNITI